MGFVCTPLLQLGITTHRSTSWGLYPLSLLYLFLVLLICLLYFLITLLSSGVLSMLDFKLGFYSIILFVAGRNNLPQKAMPATSLSLISSCTGFSVMAKLACQLQCTDVPFQVISCSPYILLPLSRRFSGHFSLPRYI